MGCSGEAYAVNLLKKCGYKILERNFRTKFGEIDIITIKDDYLVFVEVKTRKSKKYGMPEEAVTPNKIRKITKMGEYYYKFHTGLPRKLRIDVVALIVENMKVVYEKIIQVT